MAKYRCWVSLQNDEIKFYDEPFYGLAYAIDHLLNCTNMSEEDWLDDSATDTNSRYIEEFLRGDRWWPMELEVDDESLRSGSS